MKHTTIHGKIASSGSPRVSATPSESHNELGHARNMNVCTLGSDYMWCQHILIKLLDVPHFVRPHILFSIYSCHHLGQRGSLEKRFKEHQLFWIWYTMSCTTELYDYVTAWIVALLVERGKLRVTRFVQSAVRVRSSGLFATEYKKGESRG